MKDAAQTMGTLTRCLELERQAPVQRNHKILNVIRTSSRLNLISLLVYNIHVDICALCFFVLLVFIHPVYKILEIITMDIINVIRFFPVSELKYLFNINICDFLKLDLHPKLENNNNK